MPKLKLPIKLQKLMLKRLNLGWVTRAPVKTIAPILTIVQLTALRLGLVVLSQAQAECTGRAKQSHRLYKRRPVRTVLNSKKISRDWRKKTHIWVKSWVSKNWNF